MTNPFVSFSTHITQFIKRHKADLVYFLIIIILIEILTILVRYDLRLRDKIHSTQLSPAFLTEEVSSYPLFLTSYDPYLTAQSAVLLDNSSKRVLFSKNPHLRFSMASTTKLMTALVALEHFVYNDILTVKSPFRVGSIVGFEVGEQIYFDDLLYALLLQSGNDAAYIIADNYPGGFDAFISRMNEKAGEYGLTHTHFDDPAGLNDDQNYTTALDLAHFSSIALENQTVARVVSTKRKVFTDVSGNKTYEVENLNELLGYSGVIGIKTGTTHGAGEVLTTALRKDEKEYIIVVMKSEDRFLDTQNIINLLQDNVTYIHPEDLRLR